jgi:hypothetical protein
MLCCLSWFIDYYFYASTNLGSPIDTGPSSLYKNRKKAQRGRNFLVQQFNAAVVLL